MKRPLTAATLCLVVGSLTFSDIAAAQPRSYHRSHAVRSHGWHDRSDWRRGGWVSRNDWNRGQRIDYRRYHLRRPPAGYEWRQVDGNYVLAAVATGVIASLILNNH